MLRQFATARVARSSLVFISSVNTLFWYSMIFNCDNSCHGDFIFPFVKLVKSVFELMYSIIKQYVTDVNLRKILLLKISFPFIFF